LVDGGFEQVFLAFDPRLDRNVALKVLKQLDPKERLMERFFREARAAARLDHPNIVAVHDAGFDNGHCWVAFQFVSGWPLNRYRDQHRLDSPTAARILRDLADAVDHTHRQGVLHRDIKPANVLIDDHGRPRLLDFGLARRFDLDSWLSHDGAVVGTQAYMSPEQAPRFCRQVDERSDVFNLGVIFFELLSGERPYSASSPSNSSPESMLHCLSPGKSPTPSVRTNHPAVPAALDRICMRAIAQDPRERYASARSLADDLDQWLLQHRGETVRLWLPATTIILGMAAALLMFIGIRVALAPLNEQLRLAVLGLKERSVGPAETVAVSSDKPRALHGGAGTEKLIGNPGNRRYHLATCSDIELMSGSNQVVLEGLGEARAMGLQPCAHCHPPRWSNTAAGE
jgi:serine/threonine protein kinase